MLGRKREWKEEGLTRTARVREEERDQRSDDQRSGAERVEKVEQGKKEEVEVVPREWGH